MNYYNDIDNIPLWNHLKIKKHRDIRYLYELDSYLNLDEYKQSKELSDAYAHILDQYNDELLKRSDARDHFNIDKEIMQYTGERDMCYMLLSKIEILHGRDEFKDEVSDAIEKLANLGYVINPDKDIKDQLYMAMAQADSLLNRIDDLNDFKRLGSGDGKGISDEEMISAIERHRKLNLDQENTSLLQYLTYENEFIKYMKDASNKE